MVMLKVKLFFLSYRNRGPKFKLVFADSGKLASYAHDLDSAYNICEIEKWQISEHITL